MAEPDRAYLVPADPNCVPDPTTWASAIGTLRGFLPDTAVVTAEDSDYVELYDAGQAFERVVCPKCHSEIPTTWWAECLSKDWELGFQLRTWDLPCCKAEFRLDGLIYEPTQAFGRFALAVAGDHAGLVLTPEQKAQIERILGVQVKIVVCY